MTISLDSITRTSSISPEISPITCTVGYSGATAASVDLFWGGFSPGQIVTSGGPAPAGSISGTATDSLTTINGAGGAGGVSGWAVGTSGVEGNGVQVAALPLVPSTNLIATPAGTSDFDFTLPLYRNVTADLGADQATPYDYWRGTPNLTTKTTLSGVAIWVASLPWASFEWDFGDGNTSTLPNPSHHYNGFGTFIITFTATYAYSVPSGGHTSAVTTSVFIPPTSRGWYLGQVGMGAG